MTSPGMPSSTLPIRCDCGHDSTPDGFATGFATVPDGSTLCYRCAADRDLEQAQALQPGDPPLFSYIQGPQPAPHTAAEISIVTWPGIPLGVGTVYRGDAAHRTMHVIATVAGRRFWGKTPTNNGNYVRLHPYRSQS